MVRACMRELAVADSPGCKRVPTVRYIGVPKIHCVQVCVAKIRSTQIRATTVRLALQRVLPTGRRRHANHRYRYPWFYIVHPYWCVADRNRRARVK